MSIRSGFSSFFKAEHQNHRQQQGRAILACLPSKTCQCFADICILPECYETSALMPTIWQMWSWVTRLRLQNHLTSSDMKIYWLVNRDSPHGLWLPVIIPNILGSKTPAYHQPTGVEHSHPHLIPKFVNLVPSELETISGCISQWQPSHVLNDMHVLGIQPEPHSAHSQGNSSGDGWNLVIPLLCSRFPECQSLDPYGSKPNARARTNISCIIEGLGRTWNDRDDKCMIRGWYMDDKWRTFFPIYCRYDSGV